MDNLADIKLNKLTCTNNSIAAMIIYLYGTDEVPPYHKAKGDGWMDCSVKMKMKMRRSFFNRIYIRWMDGWVVTRGVM